MGRYVVEERRVIINGNLMDRKTVNRADVTVNKKKAFWGMFILVAFHSYCAIVNAKQIRGFGYKKPTNALAITYVLYYPHLHVWSPSATILRVYSMMLKSTTKSCV
jgi:hypothetical protein